MTKKKDTQDLPPGWRKFPCRAEEVATQWICMDVQHDIGNLTKFLALQPEFSGKQTRQKRDNRPAEKKR